jgi:pilus assembly protein CpaB
MRRGNTTILLVLGVLLLAVAGGGIFYVSQYSDVLTPNTAAQEGQQMMTTVVPDIDVVVASIDVSAGTVVNDPATYLTMGQVSATAYDANPDAYLLSMDEARDLKALATLRAGEPVMKDQLGAAGLSSRMPTAVPGQPALKAFPVQVDSLSGVAGLIEPGDFVDVMASFNLDVTTLRPGASQASTDGTSGELTQTTVEQSSTEGSVKVLLQDVQVLDVIKPAPVATPEGGEAPPPPPDATPVSEDQVPLNSAGTTLQTGNWLLIIAVSNQEAEVLRFALDRGIGISTLLRSSGDHTTERTVGSTLRILVDNYDMPIPNGLPPVQHPGPVQVPNVPVLPEEPVDTWAPSITPTAGTDQ